MNDRGRPANRPLWIYVASLAFAAGALWLARGAGPSAGALAVLALAAIPATIAITGRARLLLVGVLLATAAGAGWLGIAEGQLFALVAAVLLVVAGVLLGRFAATLPGMGGRFRRPGSGGTTAGGDARPEELDEADLLRALSDGRDPTETDRQP